MHLLAFAASNSRHSINKQLVTYAANVLQNQAADDTLTIDLLDLQAYEVPIYSIDREQAAGIPALAQQLYAKIGTADALLIAFAEHNGLYTAAFKNLYDWMSRIDIQIYQQKPTVMLATSPGPGGGKRVLRIAQDSAAHFGADLRATLAIPSFLEHFDPITQRITDAGLRQQLRQAVCTLLL